MFLEIPTDRRRKNADSYGLFRETFRENGPVRHRARGRVTGLNDEQLLVLRDFIRSGCPQPGATSCAVSDSREWGGRSRRAGDGQGPGMAQAALRSIGTVGALCVGPARSGLSATQNGGPGDPPRRSPTRSAYRSSCLSVPVGLFPLARIIQKRPYFTTSL